MPWFEGKTVAIVGSGPGAVENPRGMIDAHDVVVRVNNYKITGGTGRRTDCFYSFFGNSIKKQPRELKRDGVKLCICKCPNAHAIQSEWHRRHGRMLGVDFRWIYRQRADWWFCDTYIPSQEEFLSTFRLLGDRVPTTGFSAILDVLSFNPKETFVTGFDFFRSGIHNVNQRWRPGNPNDPIGHAPEREMQWLIENITKYPIKTDQRLRREMARAAKAA